MRRFAIFRRSSIVSAEESLRRLPFGSNFRNFMSSRISAGLGTCRLTIVVSFNVSRLV